jgi:hypothetical protein
MPIRLLNRRISCFTLHQVLETASICIYLPRYFCYICKDCITFVPSLFSALIAVTLQATPLRCDVIVGCEDGLLGCILGCGSPSVHGRGPANEASSSSHHAPSSHRSVDPVGADACLAAAAALERIIRVVMSDEADLQAEDAAQAASAAAAAAAAAIEAAEAHDAGVFRAIRVHDAAVLCAGVMSYAFMSRTAQLSFISVFL